MKIWYNFTSMEIFTISIFIDSNPVTCNTDRFPYNCRQESYSSNNLACVVNIPYCLRLVHMCRNVASNGVVIQQ